MGHNTPPALESPCAHAGLRTYKRHHHRSVPTDSWCSILSFPWSVGAPNFPHFPDPSHPSHFLPIQAGQVSPPPHQLQGFLLCSHRYSLCPMLFTYQHISDDKCVCLVCLLFPKGSSAQPIEGIPARFLLLSLFSNCTRDSFLLQSYRLSQCFGWNLNPEEAPVTKFLLKSL